MQMPYVCFSFSFRDGCVCVCVSVTERERERDIERNIETGFETRLWVHKDENEEIKITYAKCQVKI